jgi:hypothetical protein
VPDFRNQLFTAIGFAIAIAIVPLTASAQAVRVSPALGIYLPIGGALIVEPGFEKHQIQTGLLFGRVAVETRQLLSLEAEFGYGKGMVAIRDTARPRVVSDIRASLWTADVRGLLRLTDESTKLIVPYLGVGGGLVGRSGEAYADTPAKTRGAAVLLAGGTATTGRRGRGPRIRFEIADYLTWSQFNEGLPTQTRGRMVHDIIWSFGLSFRVH